MTSTAWEDLGYAIRQARLGKGWNLEALAQDALGNGARKGYVSQVEKGLRNLSPETIDKFDQSLDLPAEIVKAAHLAPPPETATSNKGKAKPSTKPVEDIDRDAERLLTRVEKEPDAPPVAEALLTTLAYEFAKGEYRDLQTAYIALRKALEAAESIRQRGAMPAGNTGTQLNAVMAEVARLNDQGALDQADALLDEEERRMKADHDALAERMAEARRQMLEQRLAQDRLRNDPQAAAERLIADLRQQPDRGKLFWAIDRLSDEWLDTGDRTGDIFAIRVAIALARINWERSNNKRGLAGFALHSLGWGYLRMAERSTHPGDLENAYKTLNAALAKSSKTREPLIWAAREDGLGSVLKEMGKRAADAGLLHRAVSAHRAALDVRLKKGAGAKSYWNNLGIALQKLGEINQDPAPVAEAVEALTTALALEDKTADPLDWETTQNNLALALRWQGALTGDRDLLQRARDGYAECEVLDIREKAPFIWARLQWNIADLALARFDLEPDPALLDEAEAHVTQAREVFAEGSDYQTRRCDDLLAKVSAARAALP